MIISRKILSNTPQRPGGVRSHNEQDDYHKIWKSPYKEVLLPDLLSVGALEAEGAEAERFPDIVGVNVLTYQYAVDAANPAATATAVRTQHDGMTGTCSPVPVKIKFRAAPGETVRVAVSLATVGGQPTQKAWVRLSSTDILESRGGVIYQVAGFNADGTPILEAADRVATFSLSIPPAAPNAPPSAWEPGTRIVYVYGLETTQSLDELKLVVWGEERVENKAETIADQNHHNIKHKLQSEEPPPVRRWYVTDEEPVNLVRMQWIDHENKPVSIASEVTEADLAPYTRAPGQPGGVGGYGGPHAETGFAFFQDAFRFDSVAFTPAGADGLKTITCNMTSNVSQVPTNGLDNTNAFVLKQLSSDSLAYAAENGVLGFWPTSDPGGAPGQRRTFSAMVVNPVFGFNGSKMFYETAIGSDTYQTRRVQLVATLDSLPDATTIQTMTATLTSDVPGQNGDLTTGAVMLTETAVDSNNFTSADGRLRVNIDRITANGTAAVNDFTATVTSTLLDVADQPIDAIESGLGMLEFRTDLLHNDDQGALNGAHAAAFFKKTYKISLKRLPDANINEYTGTVWNDVKMTIRDSGGTQHFENTDNFHVEGELVWSKRYPDKLFTFYEASLADAMPRRIESRKAKTNAVYAFIGDKIKAELKDFPGIYTEITIANMVWHTQAHKEIRVGRSCRFGASNENYSIIKPYHLKVSGVEDGEKITVALERNGTKFASREFKVIQNKVCVESGSEAAFCFSDIENTLQAEDISLAGATFMAKTRQGARLIATVNNLKLIQADLWLYDPHEPGDYSVNVQGKDVEKAGEVWTATKYYYTVDDQAAPYPLVPADSQKSFHADVNYLQTMNASNFGWDFDVQKDFVGGGTFYVDRYIQKGGRIAQTHINNGVISNDVKIRLCATGSISELTLNYGARATRISTGAEDANRPSVYEFTVSSRDLLTAQDRGANGARPTPEFNNIQIYDSLQNAQNGAKWTLHWFELSFDAMSPYVLVHGKGADGTFWEAHSPGQSTTCWPAFNDLLRSKEIPFDSSISLKGTRSDPSQDTVVNQAADLQTQMVPVTASFGTRHINIVAHSKGGLDSRYWLTEINPASNLGRKFVVGQYVTICTPHRGSVVADLVVVGEFVTVYDIESNTLSGGQISLDVCGFLITFRGVDNAADLAGVPNDTPATYCLRTNLITDDRRPVPAQDDCATFGALYGIKLPGYRNVDTTAPSFWAVRADADRNFDNQITLEEADEAAQYGGSSAYLGQLTYSALGRVRTISQPPGAVFLLGYSVVKLIQDAEYPLGSFQPNDLLVTYASAIYSPFNQTLIDAITHYDHGGITRTGIANQLYVRAEVMTPRK
jgi:hypothetical protein